MTSQNPSPLEPPAPPAAPRYEPTSYATSSDDATQVVAPVPASRPVFASPEAWSPAPATTPAGTPTGTPAGSTAWAGSPQPQPAPQPVPQPAPVQSSWAWTQEPPAAPRPQAAHAPKRTVTPGLLAVAVLGTALLTSGGTYLAVTAGQGRDTDATSTSATANVPAATANPGGNGAQPPVQQRQQPGQGTQPNQGQQQPAPQATPGPQNPAPDVTSGSVVDVVKAVSPSVVTITVEGVTSTDPITGMSGQGSAVGSGVIFDSNGLILTNHHVVAGDPSRVTVSLKDGRSFEGTVYGVDTMTDLAIVKVDASGLPAAQIGSSAAIEVGQVAIAIGSPLGEFKDTVTSGIVSGVGRSIETEDGALTNLIQTDTAINPGNSGGPLLDAAGQVIGINTAMAASSQGIGFAIPVDLAKPLLAQASAGQPLARAWLGVRFETIDAELQQQAGLPVANGAWLPSETAQVGGGAQDPGTQGTDPFGGQDPFGQDPTGGSQFTAPSDTVVAGSPAEQAGLKAGDIITSVNGTALQGTTTLDLLVGQLAPGSEATFGVLRDGQELTVTVALGTRPTGA